MKNRIMADLDRTEPACKMSDRYAGWGSPFLIFMQLAGCNPGAARPGETAAGLQPACPGLLTLHGQMTIVYRLQGTAAL